MVVEQGDHCVWMAMNRGDEIDQGIVELVLGGEIFHALISQKLEGCLQQGASGKHGSDDLLPIDIKAFAIHAMRVREQHGQESEVTL